MLLKGKVSEIRESELSVQIKAVWELLSVYQNAYSLKFWGSKSQHLDLVQIVRSVSPALTDVFERCVG
jgi:hypothetical protein